jgi:hypothetical protein
VFDLPPTDRAQSNPNAARSNGRQQAFLLVGAEHNRDPGRRLLEHLEEGVLGVVVESIGLLDDDDPRPAFDGEQRQLADQMPDRARLRVVRLADPNLRAGSFRSEAVQIRVIARCHLPAAAAGSTWPRTRIGVVAQEPCG